MPRTNAHATEHASEAHHESSSKSSSWKPQRRTETCRHSDAADNRSGKRKVDEIFYTDYSEVPADAVGGAAGDTIASSDRENAFPSRLYDILSKPEFSEIVTWMPHGRSWRIEAIKRFQREVMPNYFKTRAHSSFMRLVSSWGFRRKTVGKDQNSYYHEYFLRGLPHLHKNMYRLKPNSKKIKIDPDQEPDFYSISRQHPLPELEQYSLREVNSFLAFDNEFVSQRQRDLERSEFRRSRDCAEAEGGGYRFYSTLGSSRSDQTGLSLPQFSSTNRPDMWARGFDGGIPPRIISHAEVLPSPEEMCRPLGFHGGIPPRIISHAEVRPSPEEMCRQLYRSHGLQPAGNDYGIAVEGRQVASIPYGTATKTQQLHWQDIGVASSASTNPYADLPILSSPSQGHHVFHWPLYRIFERDRPNH